MSALKHLSLHKFSTGECFRSAGCWHNKRLLHVSQTQHQLQFQFSEGRTKPKGSRMMVRVKIVLRSWEMCYKTLIALESSIPSTVQQSIDIGSKRPKTVWNIGSKLSVVACQMCSTPVCCQQSVQATERKQTPCMIQNSYLGLLQHFCSPQWLFVNPMDRQLWWSPLLGSSLERRHSWTFPLTQSGSLNLLKNGTKCWNALQQHHSHTSKQNIEQTFVSGHG